MPENKKSSLKSLALTVQLHKNEVLDKKTAIVKKIGEVKTPGKQ